MNMLLPRALLIAHICHSTDTSIGKIDKSSLSQQTVMELLIDKMANKEEVCRDKHSPVDVTQWYGTNTNDNKEITSLTWGFCELRGSIQLEWLPPTLKKACFNNNSLQGLSLSQSSQIVSKFCLWRITSYQGRLM